MGPIAEIGPTAVIGRSGGPPGLGLPTSTLPRDEIGRTAVLMLLSEKATGDVLTLMPVVRRGSLGWRRLPNVADFTLAQRLYSFSPLPRRP